MSNPVIEGYQFACENWCPRCLSDEFGCGESDLESVLDQIATDAGINRDDEHSYDSQDFPKGYGRARLTASARSLPGALTCAWSAATLSASPTVTRFQMTIGQGSR